MKEVERYLSHEVRSPNACHYALPASFFVMERGLKFHCPIASSNTVDTKKKMSEFHCMFYPIFSSIRIIATLLFFLARFLSKCLQSITPCTSQHSPPSPSPKQNGLHSIQSQSPQHLPLRTNSILKIESAPSARNRRNKILPYSLVPLIPSTNLPRLLQTHLRTKSHLHLAY